MKLFLKLIFIGCLAAKSSAQGLTEPIDIPESEEGWDWESDLSLTPPITGFDYPRVKGGRKL